MPDRVGRAAREALAARDVEEQGVTITLPWLPLLKPDPASNKSHDRL